MVSPLIPRGLLPLYLLTSSSRVNPGTQPLLPHSFVPATSNHTTTSSAVGILTNPSLLLSVSVSPECISKYNELKLGKSFKYIIYKLSDDYKEIVVEDASSDPDWETFQNKLMNAKAGHKGKEGKGPRYAVYDFQYELDGGEGTRYVMIWERRNRKGVMVLM